MSWSRSKWMLVAGAAAAALALMVILLRSGPARPVGWLTRQDVVQIRETVRQSEWRAVWPGRSWKNLRGLPYRLMLFWTAHHQLRALGIQRDFALVATWHTRDRGAGFMDINWLQKHDGHWTITRRVRNVPRTNWQAFAQPGSRIPVPGAAAVF